MAENGIQRIRYIQNKSRYWSTTSLHSPGLSGFDRLKRYRFRIMKPFQANAAQVERWRYFENKRRRRGLLSAAKHLNDELAGYHGRVPFLLSNTESLSYARSWDFYILEPSEVKSKTLEVAKELETPISFWPYLSKKLVQFRGLLPINDLVECLGYLRSVDYYDPFLLKVVAREIVQDFKKLTMENIAVVLHTYIHFNCFSTALSETMQQYLRVLLYPYKDLDRKLSNAASSTHVHAKSSLQKFSDYDGLEMPLLSGYALSMFFQFFSTFHLKNASLFTALLTAFTIQHSSLDMVHISDILCSLSVLLSRFQVEEAVLHRIFFLAEEDAIKFLSSSLSQISEETLNTLVSFVYSLCKFYESRNTALPSSLRIQCITSLLARMQDECADDMSMSSWENIYAKKKSLFDALFPQPRSLLTPFCTQSQSSVVTLGDDDFDFPKTKDIPQITSRGTLQADALTNCIGKAVTSLGIMWKLQALFPQATLQSTLPANFIDNASFQTTQPTSKRDRHKRRTSPISIEMKQRGVRVLSHWWSNAKNYADMYTQMKTLQINSSAEESFLFTALYLIYVQGCGSLSASVLCNIFEIMALHRCSLGREPFFEEVAASQTHPFFTAQMRNQLLRHPSVNAFTSFLEKKTDASLHRIFFLKEVAWEITRKLKSLKPVELYRLYLAMYHGHYKEPYLLHSLYKFPSFMRIAAIRALLHKQYQVTE